MADKRDILIRLLGEETVAKMADRAGKGLDRFGDSLDATEKDAHHLDKQIAEVEGNLKHLATAFARTTDAADKVDITRAIRKQQAELRKLTKAKDLLPDFDKAGEEAASGFGASFVARIGPLLTRAPLGPAGAALGGIIAVPAAAVIGATISGALVGGVGAGGVVGGLKLAAQDSRVQAAGKQLAELVTADLDEAGGAFVGPTLDGIDVIRDAWDDVSGDIEGALSASARYVVPLAQGVADFVRELAPGVRAAAEAAGPIINVVRQDLPRVGQSLSGLLETVADHADEGASAIHLIFMAVEETIDGVSTLVDWLSSLYGALVHAGQGASHFVDGMLGWLPGIGDLIGHNRDRMDELAGALDAGGESGTEAGDNIFGGLLKVKEGAEGAVLQVRSLNEILDEFAGKTLDSRAANRAFQEAIDQATESLQKNGRTLDENTPKGRANAAALDEIARTAIANSAAILAMTGDQEKANEATKAGRTAFIKAATAMGMEKEEAIALADKLFAIPNINRTVKIKVVTKYETQGSAPGEHIIGQGTLLKGLSAGGMVTGSGPKGVDTQPRMLAVGEGVLTAGEVDSLGGPAGFERLRAAIRGGRSAPGMAIGAGPSPAPAQPARTVIELRSGGSRLDDLLVEILRRAISDRGGNVQTVLGR